MSPRPHMALSSANSARPGPNRGYCGSAQLSDPHHSHSGRPQLGHMAPLCSWQHCARLPQEPPLQERLVLRGHVGPATPGGHLGSGWHQSQQSLPSRDRAECWEPMSCFPGLPGPALQVGPPGIPLWFLDTTAMDFSTYPPSTLCAHFLAVIWKAEREGETFVR